MMTLNEVNRLSDREFIAAFGDIAEHSSWVAAQAASDRPFATVAAMVEAFANAVRSADGSTKLALIEAHPDLASRAQMARASQREQAGAGLDSLSGNELARVTDFNARYRARFGFPFIVAVRGANKHQILRSFEERINHPREVEFETAIDQICRILQFRIEDRVAP